MSLNISREQAIEDFTKCAALIPEGMDPYEYCKVPRTFEELHGLSDLPQDKDATPHLAKLEEWAHQPKIGRWLHRKHLLTGLPFLLPSKQLSVGYELLKPVLRCEGAQLCNRDQITTTSQLTGLDGVLAAAVLLVHQGLKAAEKGNADGALESIMALQRIRTFVARDPCLYTRYYEAAVLSITCQFMQTLRGKNSGRFKVQANLLEASANLKFSISENQMWIGDMIHTIGCFNRPYQLRRCAQLSASSNDFIANVFNSLDDPVLFARALLGLACQSWVVGHSMVSQKSPFVLVYEDYLRRENDVRLNGNLAEQVSAASFPRLETLLQGFKMCELVMRRTLVCE